MRAIQVKQYLKGPHEMQVTNLPTPEPDPNYYLIKIHACGINFFDLLQIQGKYQVQPPLPWISGSEFSGEVIATPTEGPEQGSAEENASTTGKKGHRYKVGDRVFGAFQGAYATHILCPEMWLYPVPENWSYADAAGIFVTMPTAYSALITRAHTQPGEWVLVHAGAGGVGLAAVQVAKALGATVIATASSERKRQVCLDYGADFVIDYGQKDWPQQVIALCKKHRTGVSQEGVDVVYDPVGQIDLSMKCIAWNGRLLVIGFTGGSIEKVAMNRVLLKNISIVGLHWGVYKVKESDTVPVVWNGIFDMIAQGKLKPITYTDKEYKGLESVPKALKAMSERGTWGKVAVALGDHEGEESKSKL